VATNLNRRSFRGGRSHGGKPGLECFLQALNRERVGDRAS